MVPRPRNLRKATPRARWVSLALTALACIFFNYQACFFAAPPPMPTTQESDGVDTQAALASPAPALPVEDEASTKAVPAVATETVAEVAEKKAKGRSSPKGFRSKPRKGQNMTAEQRVHKLERQNSELRKANQDLKQEVNRLKQLLKPKLPKHVINLTDCEEGLDADGGWDSPAFSLRDIQGLSLRFFPRGRGDDAGTGHSSAFLMSERGLSVRAAITVDGVTRAFESPRTIEAGEESGWVQFGAAQESYKTATITLLDANPQVTKAAPAATEAAPSSAGEAEASQSPVEELDAAAAGDLLGDLPGAAAEAAPPAASPEGSAAA